MSGDSYSKVLDKQARERARVNYIFQHAPILHAALIGLQDGGQPLYTACGAAPLAVAAAGALFDALPTNPDAEGGSAPSGWERTQRPAQGLVEEHTVPADLDEGPALPEIPPLPGPAPLLPVEPEVTTRAPSLSIWDDMHEVSPAVLARASQEEPSAPTCTCTGKQPCSAECRRCVPERRQSAGPDEATHAGRVRVRSASGILALGAACRQTCDPAVRALAHAAAAQAGATRCDHCGERLRVFEAARPELVQQ